MGYAGNGALALVVLDTDVDQSANVVEGVTTSIEDYGFQPTLPIAVGAAGYPTHAVDVDSLQREGELASGRELAPSARSSPHRTEAGS